MLKGLAAELGVERQVCFAGWVSDTDSFYHAIDINTLTSLSETFPYSLTEGARAALPTIASRVGGVPYLIEHGVHGLLFEAGDADTLARHLITLAKDPTLRQHLGERLYQRGREDFSLESTLERQLNIYETILRRQSRKKAAGTAPWYAAPTAGATPVTTPSWRPLSPSCARSTRISPSGCSPATRTTPASPTGSTPSTPLPSPASCGGCAKPTSTSTAAAP